MEGWTKKKRMMRVAIILPAFLPSIPLLLFAEIDRPESDTGEGEEEREEGVHYHLLVVDTNEVGTAGVASLVEETVK
jgi:hypothetical protein